MDSFYSMLLDLFVLLLLNNEYDGMSRSIIIRTLKNVKKEEIENYLNIEDKISLLLYNGYKEVLKQESKSSSKERVYNEILL